jgi:hypothetical protein
MANDECQCAACLAAEVIVHGEKAKQAGGGRGDGGERVSGGVR